MAPGGLKRGPITRVCHVCGRQYGLSSFEIHLKQCKKLWIAQEELKPPHERRELPKTPPGIGQAIESAQGDPRDTREAIEALNRVAQEAFNEHGMETCENCGRTFAEGRLAIHNRSCRPDSVAKKVTEGAAPRNKRVESAQEYGRSVKPASPQRPKRSEQEQMRTQPPSVQPETNKYETQNQRPLSGSLASNRKRIAAGAVATNTSARANMQSPLGPTIDATQLKAELSNASDSALSMVESKLEKWEAVTMATLQEIRDLRALFQEMRSSSTS